MAKIYQKSFSDGKNAGFTLIELLVVVLIIGILAAIAVPQYQRVVDKSRLTQVMTWAAPLIQAEKLYYMANGKYSPYMEELDTQVADCEFKSISYEAQGGRGRYTCNGDWTVDLNAWQKRIHIYLPDGGPVGSTVEFQFYLDQKKTLCGLRPVAGEMYVPVLAGPVRAEPALYSIGKFPIN